MSTIAPAPFYVLHDQFAHAAEAPIEAWKRRASKPALKEPQLQVQSIIKASPLHRGKQKYRQLFLARRV